MENNKFYNLHFDEPIKVIKSVPYSTILNVIEKEDIKVKSIIIEKWINSVYIQPKNINKDPLHMFYTIQKQCKSKFLIPVKDIKQIINKFHNNKIYNDNKVIGNKITDKLYYYTVPRIIEYKTKDISLQDKRKIEGKISAKVRKEKKDKIIKELIKDKTLTENEILKLTKENNIKIDRRTIKRTIKENNIKIMEKKNSTEVIIEKLNEIFNGEILIGKKITNKLISLNCNLSETTIDRFFKNNKEYRLKVLTHNILQDSPDL